MKEKRKLPAKCVNLKAAYLPATKWWCSFCGPTGGNVCYAVCLMIGKTEESKK
ncbi:MAG: hypothetical protein ACEPO8_09350 [Rhodothermaceae bacterium]